MQLKRQLKEQESLVSSLVSFILFNYLLHYPPIKGFLPPNQTLVEFHGDPKLFNRNRDLADTLARVSRDGKETRRRLIFWKQILDLLWTFCHFYSFLHSCRVSNMNNELNKDRNLFLKIGKERKRTRRKTRSLLWLQNIGSCIFFFLHVMFKKCSKK